MSKRSLDAQNLVDQKFVVFHRQDTHLSISTYIHIKEFHDVWLDAPWDLDMEFVIIGLENVEALVIIIASHKVAIHLV